MLLEGIYNNRKLTGRFGEQEERPPNGFQGMSKVVSGLEGTKKKKKSREREKKKARSGESMPLKQEK